MRKLRHVTDDFPSVAEKRITLIRITPGKGPEDGQRFAIEPGAKLMLLSTALPEDEIVAVWIGKLTGHAFEVLEETRRRWVDELRALVLD